MDFGACRTGVDSSTLSCTFSKVWFSSLEVISTRIDPSNEIPTGLGVKNFHPKIRSGSIHLRIQNSTKAFILFSNGMKNNLLFADSINVFVQVPSGAFRKIVL